MTKKQQFVLALAMLGVVVMLLWVPYTATYKWEDSSWTTASAGYDWVFGEPNALICQLSIEQHLKVKFNPNRFDVTLCHIALDSRRLTMTLIAAGIGVSAVLLLLGIFGHRRAAPTQPDRTLAELSGSPARPQASKFANALLRINPLLPISSGDMSESAPLVITAKTDYVSVEYSVLDIIFKELDEFDAELESQSLIERNGRKIDALTYRLKEKGGAACSRRNTYYFDITAGMNEMRRRIDKQWWQVWK